MALRWVTGVTASAGMQGVQCSRCPPMGAPPPARLALSFPPLPPSGATAYAGGFRLKGKSVQFRYTHISPLGA